MLLFSDVCMRMTDNRISVKETTARWDPDAEVSVKEAMDFWSFAAAAANVVMQLAWPGSRLRRRRKQGRLRAAS